MWELRRLMHSPHRPPELGRDTGTHEGRPPAEPLVGAPPRPGAPLSLGTPSTYIRFLNICVGARPEFRGRPARAGTLWFQRPPATALIPALGLWPAAPPRCPPSPSPPRLSQLTAQAWDQGAWLGLGTPVTVAQASAPPHLEHADAGACLRL